MSMVLESGSELALQSEVRELNEPKREHLWELLVGDNDHNGVFVLPPLSSFAACPLSLSTVNVARAYITDNARALPPRKWAPWWRAQQVTSWLNNLVW